MCSPTRQQHETHLSEQMTTKNPLRRHVRVRRQREHQTSRRASPSWLISIEGRLSPQESAPAQVTSGPIAVQEIWGLYRGQEKRAGITSLAIHVVVVGLLLLASIHPAIRAAARQQIALIAPDLAPYHLKSMAGGGGGGDRSRLPASKGELPNIAAKQFIPPTVTHIEPAARHGSDAYHSTGCEHDQSRYGCDG